MDVVGMLLFVYIGATDELICLFWWLLHERILKIHEIFAELKLLFIELIVNIVNIIVIVLILQVEILIHRRK
jgi:hypothetical protein